MKKFIGLVLAATVLAVAGCELISLGSSLKVKTKKISCSDLPQQVSTAENTRFKVSGNCDIDKPIRITGNNITIAGHGATLEKGHPQDGVPFDGIIVEGRNIIIDGLNFQGFKIPIFVARNARAVVSNVTIKDSGVAGIAITKPPTPEPPPVLLKRRPLFDSFEWISTAHAESCNGITGESLCAVAQQVLEGFGALSLGGECPQLTLCGRVGITATVPNSSAIYVGNSSTLDNRAKLSITVNSQPSTSKGLNISGSTVNLEQATNINNVSGWGIYFDNRGGTLNVDAGTSISNPNAVHCEQGNITGAAAPRALSSQCSSDDD